MPCWTSVAAAQHDSTVVTNPIASPKLGGGPSSLEEQRRAATVLGGEAAAKGESGIRITVGDLEDVIATQPAEMRQRYKDNKALVNLAEELLRFELLAAAAERHGTGKDAAVIRSTKQNAVQQLVQSEFDAKLSPEAIPDSEVEAYYQKNIDKFERAELVRASHIVVAQQAQAQELIEQLRHSDPKAFAAKASELSLDTETKLRGGDLQYFARDGKSPNHQDVPIDSHVAVAAFALRDIGDLSPKPVRVGKRWSVVKLTARRPALHRSLREVERGIRVDLWREQRKAAVERFVADLEKRSGVESHYDRLAWIDIQRLPGAQLLKTAPKLPSTPSAAAKK